MMTITIRPAPLLWFVGIPLVAALTAWIFTTQYQYFADISQEFPHPWVIGGAVGGCLMGILQWVAIRLRVGQARWKMAATNGWLAGVGWVVLTTGGWLAGAGIAAAIPRPFLAPPVDDNIMDLKIVFELMALMIDLLPPTALIGGLIVGVSQWLILRQRFDHSGWWSIASVFGSVLGVGAIYLLAVLDLPMALYVGAGVGASTYALATWIVVLRLVPKRHSVPSFNDGVDAV